MTRIRAGTAPLVPSGTAWLLTVAALTLSACAPIQPIAPSPTVIVEPSPSPSPSPTVNFLEPTVPAELAATWQRSVGGERVDLSLHIGYTIQRGGGRGSGRVTVDGDRIEFYASNLCDGTGVYTWSVEGDVLTFTMVGTDPCTGRSEVLVPGSFRRYVP